MTTTGPAPASRRLLMLQWFLRAVAAGLFASLLAGLLGLVLRDRVWLLAMLMYVPLVPLGSAAVIWELAARGRGLPRWRWVLGATGVIACACGALTMLGWGSPTSAGPVAGVTPITVMHWNVRWGGGGSGVDGKMERWDLLCRDMVGRAPDIVILSECPQNQRLDHLLRTLGSGWTLARSENAPRAPYLYRLVVASRWPVTLERESAIPNGRVMQAVVRAPGGDMRVLVVDGESAPWHDRTPRLGAVAQILRDAALSGAPIDVVAGDFNATRRSIGFDAIEDAGFVSAGATSPGWCATWPSICPLYDIDHLWVSNRWAIDAFERFTNGVTDHRGQLARIARGAAQHAHLTR